MKLHTKLLIALALGIALGAALHSAGGSPWVDMLNVNVLRPIGQIFLRLIFMIVVPMVFSALVIGVYELGRGHGLAGVASRTLAFTIILSTASVVIGISLVDVIRPGAAFQVQTPQAGATGVPGAPAGSGVPGGPAGSGSNVPGGPTGSSVPGGPTGSSVPGGAGATGGIEAIEASAAAVKPISQIIVELIPRNPIETAVRALDGDMLQLMIFALIFGVAASAATPAASADNVLIRLLEQVFAACMQIVHFAMKLAPIAVFAIIFNTALTFGTGIFASLFLYVLTVVLGLLLQQFVVYPVMLRLIARRSPMQFFRSCREVYLYAFSTASSNATLPLSLEVAETKLALPPNISRFVLTVGSTANQNGTALFEGITVLFLAQVYGLNLTVGDELRVLLMSILAGIGTAGVPGGSLPMVLLLAQSVGVPAEGMGLILGVDRFLDMCRTAVNVGGDLVIAALVSGPAPTSA